MSSYRTIALPVALIIVAACTTERPRQATLDAPVTWNPSPGISGMSAVSSDEYLIVHDAKAYDPMKNRIGILRVDPSCASVTYMPLDFPTASSPSNDLEGVCPIPGRANEFLLNESGYWEEKYGRVFHIKLVDRRIELVREFQLPLLRDNNRNQKDGDQFEGIACCSINGSELLIIIGERGGTSVYPEGVLRWGKYNLETGQVEWSNESLSVAAPNPWKTKSLRSITGLAVDESGLLWASAAVDPGGASGPFRSLVYSIGKVEVSDSPPVRMSALSAGWIIDGFKIESVVVSPSDASLVIGTEDEGLGGAWRLLPHL